MNYTQNWNSEFQKNTAFIDRKSINIALELGSYEGLTSNYICDNLLSHNGTLICIDPLEDGYELDGDNDLFRGQFDRFMENTAENADKIFLIRKKSEQVLQFLRSDSFDFIYIDGHHTFPAVYLDGTEAFRLCRVGGFILFDDLNWGNQLPVKKAIEQIFEENTNYRLLLKLNQVFIQKLEPGSKTEDGQDRYQEMTTEILFSDDKIYAAFCNLDTRQDRNEHMQTELNRVGFTVKR
jgi:predicted O-methyltransferase YrrM